MSHSNDDFLFILRSIDNTLKGMALTLQQLLLQNQTAPPPAAPVRKKITGFPSREEMMEPEDSDLVWMQK